MKTFSKVFIISFICFFIALTIGGYAYLQEQNIDPREGLGVGFYENIDINNILVEKLEAKPKEPEVYSTLEEAMEKSSRINFLILGMEDIRTDTIFLASFCPDTKKMDIISIPRDTYIHRKGYNRGEQRKINSVYGAHKIGGVKKTIKHILEDIPIHHYVILEYEGVEKIVDALGGIEVDVPFHMKYKDPTSKPPLNIDIPQGVQLLNGKQSMDFLRYRKGNNNKGGYVDGDLGRIKAQQEFLKSFSKKSLSNILTVIRKGFTYVKTDVKLLEGLSYGRKALGMTGDDVNFQILPGKGEFRVINKKVLSYYIYNPEESKELLKTIYNVKN